MSTSIRWLEGPSVDVPFYMGAALAGWAMLLLHVVVGVPAFHLYWFWILFLDGPHLWATISRTYLDREERRTRGPLFIGAFAWALLPIATLAWGHVTGNRVPFALFLVFAQLWAYWHVVRQHYGFLSLYQRKGGEPAGAQNPFDAAVFYVVMLAPFASWALRHPTARTSLGLGPALGTVERGLVWSLGALTAAAVVAYVVKELRRRKTINPGKNLFLASCVPLHLAVLLHPTWSLRIELVALAVIVTSFHNIQYNAIVWCFGRRRYGRDPQGETYGLAARLFRNPIAWYAIGAALAVVMRYASWSFDGRYWPLTPHTHARTGVFSAAEYINALWWVVAMHHYYLDQKIWRVSRDAGVRSGLGLAPAP